MLPQTLPGFLLLDALIVYRCVVRSHWRVPATPGHRPFVTSFRSSCLLLTIISILAVDFGKVFPRRFAKTELWGVSVMDGGTGSTIVSMGLLEGLRSREQVHLGHSLARTLPVLAIGIARSVALKAINYQVLYRAADGLTRH